MRVAVTGAAGFVGGAVCRHLAAAGWVVDPLDLRDGAPVVAGGAATRGWDIASGPLGDPPTVQAVVHVAALVSDVGGVAAARRVNVTGTANVAASFPDARFVHVSSGSVYDPHRPQVAAREDEAPPPDTVRWSNAYGRTKAEAERLLARVRPDAVVLRPHAVYGPGDTTLLPRLRRAGARGRLPVPGTGRQVHSITRVDNLAEACRLACLPAAAPGTYNVNDGVPLPLGEVMLALATPPDGPPPRLVPVPVRLALAVGITAETAAAALTRLTGRPRRPTVSRYAVEHLALERTFSIAAARAGIGFEPRPPSVAEAAGW